MMGWLVAVLLAISAFFPRDALLHRSSVPIQPSTGSIAVIPNTPSNRSLAAILDQYLTAFGDGNLKQAYRLFADIAPHQSLAQFEAKGDPQDGWTIRLTRVYVFARHGVADAYGVMQVRPAGKAASRRLIFAFPMIREPAGWRMVYNIGDFGPSVETLFQKVNAEMNAALPHLPKI